MIKCNLCHDEIKSGLNDILSHLRNASPHPMPDECIFCHLDMDDDEKQITLMETNHDMGSPDEKLARAYRRYLRG